MDWSRHEKPKDNFGQKRIHHKYQARQPNQVAVHPVLQKQMQGFPSDVWESGEGQSDPQPSPHGSTQ